MRWRFFSGKFAWVREAPKYTPPHHFLLFPRCLSVYLPYSILGGAFFFFPVWGQNTVAYFPSPHNILPHFCNIPPLLISSRTVRNTRIQVPTFFCSSCVYYKCGKSLVRSFFFSRVCIVPRAIRNGGFEGAIDWFPFFSNKSLIWSVPQESRQQWKKIYRATHTLLFPHKKGTRKGPFFIGHGLSRRNNTSVVVVLYGNASKLEMNCCLSRHSVLKQEDEDLIFFYSKKIGEVKRWGQG